MDVLYSAWEGTVASLLDDRWAEATQRPADIILDGRVYKDQEATIPLPFQKIAELQPQKRAMKDTRFIFLMSIHSQ